MMSSAASTTESWHSMQKVYRIIREKFKDEPLSSEGSRLYGGRWNPKGTGIIYTTSSPALGLLEMLAHAPGVHYEFLPKFALFEIEIPDSLRSYEINELPSYWLDHRYEKTQHFLRPWLQNPDVLSIAIPSVIVPFSKNFLIHPGHPLFKDVKVLREEPIPVDKRLWKDRR